MKTVRFLDKEISVLKSNFSWKNEFETFARIDLEAGIVPLNPSFTEEKAKEKKGVKKQRKRR